jgi:predicted MFS family arabinose efflux permease
MASVAGPLLGGFIVQHWSWHWIFYVNLPIGLVALVVIAVTLPASRGAGHPAIDYLGAGLLVGGLSAIVLVTSLGDTTWEWASTETFVALALGLVALVLFSVVERRAAEPVLPQALWREPVFRVAGVLSLIVGFALFGAVTFLPLYFQTVDADTPTESGLRMLPMMLGLLVTSIASGQAISRIGRYKAFPIAGTAVMTVGMFLLSRLEVGTTTAVASLYLLVLGLGMGLVMQVLVLAVQNSVPYAVLGTATSWALVRIEEHGFAGARGMAEAQGVPPERIAEVVAELRSDGLVAGEAGALELTAAGRALTDQVVAARRDLLEEAVADPATNRRPEVDDLLRRLARELVGERP